MLTKNGKKCIKNLVRQIGAKAYGIATDETDITIVMANGAEKQIKNTWNAYTFPQVESANLFDPVAIGPGRGISFGTGSATPTENDYTITPVSGVDYQALDKISARCYIDNDEVCCDLVYLYQNYSQNKNTVTLNEFGLFSSTTSTGKASELILVYRDVFDEPVVIPYGERKFIKITIKMGW